MISNKKQIVDLLNQNSQRLEELGVKRIGVFGSFVRGEQTDKSDIDLLVEFDKKQKTAVTFDDAENFILSLWENT